MTTGSPVAASASEKKRPRIKSRTEGFEVAAANRDVLRDRCLTGAKGRPAVDTERNAPAWLQHDGVGHARRLDARLPADRIGQLA